MGIRAAEVTWIRSAGGDNPQYRFGVCAARWQEGLFVFWHAPLSAPTSISQVRITCGLSGGKVAMLRWEGRSGTG